MTTALVLSALYEESILTQEEIDSYYLAQAIGMQNIRPSWQIARDNATLQGELAVAEAKAREAYQSRWHRCTAYCKKFIARLFR